MIKKTTLLFIWGLASTIVATDSYAGKVMIHKNSTTGLLTWVVENNGFRVEFIQLIPDFVRAVYAKHHFPPGEVKNISSYCVFGSILKNTSQQHLSYRVANWHYRTKDGKTYPVKTKTQWLNEWKKKGIVFSWTLLPDIGEFDVGDWQQGFTTIRLPRNTKFDLFYNWKLGNKKFSGVVKNMQCAPENIDMGNNK